MIPVESKYTRTPISNPAFLRGNPYVMDHSWSIHIHNRERFTSLRFIEWADFPSLPEMLGRLGEWQVRIVGVWYRPGSHAFSTRWIFW